MTLKKLSTGWLLVLCCRVWADPSLNVPLDHWGYGFVERFEARGVLQGIGDGIKPLSRQEMARILDTITAEREKGLVLSAVDSEELRQLRAEFAPPAGVPPNIAGGPGELYQYHTPQGTMGVYGLVRQQSDFFTGRGRSQTERVYRNRLGGVVQGDFMDRVGFRISFAQSREQGSRTYLIRDDLYERRLELPQLKGGVADFHEGTAYLTFSWSSVDVELGKDEVSWGPGPEDNLGLSHNAPSFDLIRLRAHYGAFKLVSVTGFLRPCPDRWDSPVCGGGDKDLQASYIVNSTARDLEREKHLAAHRLEVAAAPWLDLGFEEMVVYGDRGLQPAYLNPLMFYWAAQSYLGDKDNVLMGVDADIHPGHGVRGYFAYVVDDLKKARIFSSDFANKFSFQTGVLWTGPLGLRDTDLRAEYVRIEPWIYTHKFPVNTYRHFDAPLGYNLGPNTDRWQMNLTRRFAGGWGTRLDLSRTRHGDNELLPDGSIRNVGGDLNLGPRSTDPQTSKKFLDGQLSRRTLVGGTVWWRGRWPLSLNAGYAYEWGTGVPLPPRWDKGVALQNRTGYGKGGQGHFSFELRYGLL